MAQNDDVVFISSDEEEKTEEDEVEEEEEEDEHYDVERIRRWRYNKKKRRREFFIKWMGYDESENTWEPEENMDCPDALRRFKYSLTREERSNLNSRDPDKLSGFQRNASLIKCLGADGPHELDCERSPKEREEHRFYILLKFDDSDSHEEITWRDYFNHRPREAFEFFESRLFGGR